MGYVTLEEAEDAIHVHLVGVKRHWTLITCTL